MVIVFARICLILGSGSAAHDLAPPARMVPFAASLHTKPLRDSPTDRGLCLSGMPPSPQLTPSHNSGARFVVYPWASLPGTVGQRNYFNGIDTVWAIYVNLYGYGVPPKLRTESQGQLGYSRRILINAESAAGCCLRLG